MLNNDLNLNGSDITQESLTSLITEGTEISEELRLKLGNIKIKISGSKDPNIIIAISKIFGEEYITSTGDSYITYDMYCSVINLIRVLGTQKAKEIL